MEARQVPCFVGVDLSKNEDLTAVVAAFRDGESYLLHPVFFCPEEALRARGERHGVDYVEWTRLGYIIPTPGSVVDFRAVEEHIRELAATYNVREIAFDPTYGRSMMADLCDDGLPAAEFRQGWVSMAPAVQTREAIDHATKPLGCNASGDLFVHLYQNEPTIAAIRLVDV
jgi:phage terminase large subunit-like protein